MTDELTELRAENERLRALCVPLTDLVQELNLSRQNLQHARAMSGAHFTRAEKAEQECRDRECTEQDVRARLADAENALATAKAEVLREMAEAWDDDASPLARVSSRYVRNSLLRRAAALDGTS